jgi:hypothetical protein
MVAQLTCWFFNTSNPPRGRDPKIPGTSPLALSTGTDLALEAPSQDPPPNTPSRQPAGSPQKVLAKVAALSSAASENRRQNMHQVKQLAGLVCSRLTATYCRRFRHRLRCFPPLPCPFKPARPDRAGPCWRETLSPEMSLLDYRLIAVNGFSCLGRLVNRGTQNADLWC